MASPCTPVDFGFDATATIGLPQVNAPLRLRPGMTLGRYIVLDAVGAGGMGEVVAAYDPELDRKVAIKVLRSSERRRLGREGRARLLHEARAIASLCDRNVLPVYHVGEFEGELFLAMKLVDGVPLGRHCTDHPWQQVLPLLLAAGRGLAAAHRAGLVHRDVKPSNILVDRDGEVYVMDFGLARPLGRDSLDLPVAPESDEHDVDELLALPVTQAGAIIGTPVYMAPEQHEGTNVDARADQFSFCIVAWELLFGVYPFDGGCPGGLLEAKRAGPTRTPRARRVPRRIERALVRGLAADPARRHASMDALLAAMQGRTRHGWLRLGGAATICGAIAIAAAWPRTEPCSGGERLASAWDDGHREVLAQSFAGASTEEAREVGPRVIAALDTYAETWRAAYEQTCADRVALGEELYDARMSCLGRRVVELGALVEVLARVDDQTAVHAASAVHAWSSAGACEDAGAGTQAVTEDPEIAELLARARALLLAGRYVDAVTAAEDAVAIAMSRGDVHARIEAAIVQGDALIRGGDSDRGQASYEQAVQEANGAGLDEAAARAATRLMRYFAIAHQVEDAMLWSRHAEGALRRLGAPSRLQADWLEALGIARGNGGDYAGSRAAFEQALALQHELGGDQTLEAAALHNGLAVTLDSLGHWHLARAEFEHSIATSVRLLGDRHPSVALRLMNLGHIELKLRLREESRGHFARALQLAEETLAPVHPQIGVAARGLAEAELASGDPNAAEPLARRALELLSGAYGPNDSRTARSHLVLARIALAQGRDDDAHAHASSALSIYDAASGARHVDTAFAHDTLADALLRQGRAREAHEHYLQALGVIEASLGPDHHDLAHVLEGLARAALALGDTNGATVAAARALAIVEQEGAEHLELAHALALVAAAELAAGDVDTAAQRAARARVLVEALRERGRADEAIAAWIVRLDRGVREHDTVPTPIPALLH